MVGRRVGRGRRSMWCRLGVVAVIVAIVLGRVEYRYRGS